MTGKPSPARLRSPTTLLTILFLATLVAAKYFMRGTAADTDAVRGALYLGAALCGVQLFHEWILRPALGRFQVPGILQTIVKVILFFVVCFSVLRSWYGFDIMPLLTTSAVLSFVLGLALQDTLANFFAGLTINLDKPYKVGDWLRSGDSVCRVVEVNWRTTRLLTTDNQYRVIPNNTLAREMIENLSSPGPVSALWIHVDAAYAHPPNQVREVILEGLSRLGSLPTLRAPEVMLLNYAESGITYGIRIWLDDWSRRSQVANDVRIQLWYAFRRHQIGFPYPVRDVVLHRAKPDTDAMPLERRIALLGQCPIFSGQPPATLQALAADMTWSQHASGEILFREGDQGSSLLLVTEGRVQVVRAGQVLAELGVGSLVGEMSLLTGEPRSATVRALGDCGCLFLSKEVFRAVLALHPEMLDPISEVIAQRQLDTQQALELAQQQKSGVARSGVPETIKRQLLSLMRGFLR